MYRCRDDTSTIVTSNEYSCCYHLSFVCTHELRHSRLVTAAVIFNPFPDTMITSTCVSKMDYNIQAKFRYNKNCVAWKYWSYPTRFTIFYYDANEMFHGVYEKYNNFNLILHICSILNWFDRLIGAIYLMIIWPKFYTELSCEKRRKIQLGGKQLEL